MYIKHSLRSRPFETGWGIARKENGSGHAGYMKHTIMPVLFCKLPIAPGMIMFLAGGNVRMILMSCFSNMKIYTR